MAHHNLFFHHLRRNSHQVGQPRKISPKPPFPGIYFEPFASRTEPRHCSPRSKSPPQSLQILEKRPQSYCYLEFHQIVHQVLCPQVFYHGVSVHHRQQQDETPCYPTSGRSILCVGPQLPFQNRGSPHLQEDNPSQVHPERCPC